MEVVCARPRGGRRKLWSTWAVREQAKEIWGLKTGWRAEPWSSVHRNVVARDLERLVNMGILERVGSLFRAGLKPDWDALHDLYADLDGPEPDEDAIVPVWHAAVDRTNRTSHESEDESKEHETLLWNKFQEFIQSARAAAASRVAVRDEDGVPIAKWNMKWEDVRVVAEGCVAAPCERATRSVPKPRRTATVSRTCGASSGQGRSA